MKTSLLTLTATVAALAIAAPAFAAETTNTMENIKESVSKTGEKITAETERLKNDAERNYNEVRAEKKAETANKLDPRNNRYSQLEDTNIYNAAGDKIAELEDILIDNSGKIAMAVVSVDDAYRTVNYNTLAVATIKNEPRLTIPANTMQAAKQVKYDSDDAASLAALMPAADGAYSLDSLEGSKLKDMAGNTLGEVNDFHISNGMVSQVHFKHDKLLGMGGTEGKLAFGDVNIVRDGDDFSFQVSNEMATRIKNAPKN